MDLPAGNWAIPVHPDHAAEISGTDRERELLECWWSFSEFLQHWTFLDQERGQPRKLGDNLWPGQRQFIEAMERQGMIYALKARKLGFTTLAVAYCGWVFRFRDQNARVHLFSRRDDAAVELLRAVKYGLRRLPDWMQLPEITSTTHTLEWEAGPSDQRMLKAYPANEDTAVEATASHGMVDEWARMGNPERVWQAIEPSMAGTCHIVTTGLGPINFTAKYWRDSLAEDTPFTPIFIDALQREGRGQAWLDAKRRSMTEEHFRQEYPMSWEDALFGGGRFTFRGIDVAAAGRGTGPARAERGRKYVKGWDIGRHADAAVGVVIDATEEPNQVVAYVRLREAPYPVVQAAIERFHDQYPGKTVIEANNAGEAVAENLDIPQRQIVLFNTTPKSKAKIIEMLQFSLENRDLQWSAAEWPQLDAEVRGYQIPDDNIVQDSVIALAIANAHVSVAAGVGGLGDIGEWG